MSPVASGRAIFVFCLGLALAACAAPPPPGSDAIARASAIVKTAASDVELVASQARAYANTNIRERTLIEVEEAEVILTKARNAREDLRKAFKAAQAELARMRAKTLAEEVEIFGEQPEMRRDYAIESGAAERAARAWAALAMSDVHIAAMARTVAALQKLEIVGGR